MAVYPNRGIIDAAFAVVHDGVQRSVFASGRLPVDRAETKIGPLTIDVVEPLRVTRVRADAADLGIDADVTFTARTVAMEEPRQVITNGTKTMMDSTRMTQWGNWTGSITAGGATIPVQNMLGTKDRSWGVRPIGAPTPAAPDLSLPQVFFLWAPLHFDDECSHFFCFERGNGDRGKRPGTAQQSQRVADVLEKIAHGTVSFINSAVRPGTRRAPRHGEPVPRGLGQDAPHLAVQPSPGGPLAARVADPGQFFEGVADHPFALARRGGQPDQQQSHFSSGGLRPAGHPYTVARGAPRAPLRSGGSLSALARDARHESVFRRRSMPAVMPEIAR